mmetsp:Transcript_3769/g.9503  ORF Transcript_3769/g.9503 Transcript_3769/m.9503 type:complete len:353 (+) Transcript_3769:153-1211(+)
MVAHAVKSPAEEVAAQVGLQQQRPLVRQPNVPSDQRHSWSHLGVRVLDMLPDGGKVLNRVPRDNCSSIRVCRCAVLPLPLLRPEKRPEGPPQPQHVPVRVARPLAYLACVCVHVEKHRSVIRECTCPPSPPHARQHLHARPLRRARCDDAQGRQGRVRGQQLGDVVAVLEPLLDDPVSPCARVSKGLVAQPPLLVPVFDHDRCSLKRRRNGHAQPLPVLEEGPLVLDTVARIGGNEAVEGRERAVCAPEREPVLRGRVQQVAAVPSHNPSEIPRRPAPHGGGEGVGGGEEDDEGPGERAGAAEEVKGDACARQGDVAEVLGEVVLERARAVVRAGPEHEGEGARVGVHASRE